VFAEINPLYKYLNGLIALKFKGLNIFLVF